MLNQRIPQQVGRFEILEPMRPTTCGTLCRARAVGNDHEFALLLASAAEVANQSAASSFPARAQAASHFSHVNVAGISEIGEVDGVSFVASELPPGRGLNKLRWRGAASRETALHILAQLATALDAAHEAGLFHGSLTPDVVWIGPNPAGTDRWHVTLLGLGLSWPDDGAEGVGRHHHECLAPERRNPDRWIEVGAASDIYSYAAIAKTLLRIRQPGRDLNGTMTSLWNALEPALLDDPGKRPARADAIFAEIRHKLAPPTTSLLPDATVTRTDGTALPVAQLLGLSVVLLMLFSIVFLAGQRLLPKLGRGSSNVAAQADDPSVIQIALLTQTVLEATASVPSLNTPIDPTNTPKPSVTPTPNPTVTRRPTATHTPKPTLTPTQTPTLVIPTDTPVLPPSRATAATRGATVPMVAIPVLREPPTGATANGTVTFSWAWNGPALPANQGFEVRIWKEGQPDHYGAASPAHETNQEVDLRAAYGVQTGGGGTYFWTVALVQLEPYARVGQEAAPYSLVIPLGDSSGGGGDSNPPDPPPTVPPEPE